VSGVVSVPAHEVEHVVDQNGAGDMFASGFLYGLALGADPVEAAELGSLCAGEIISHLGARPENDLEELAIEAGLLCSLDPLRVEDGVELSRADRLPLHPRDGDGDAREQHQRVAADPHDRAAQVDVREDAVAFVDPTRRHRRIGKARVRGHARASPVNVSTGTAAIT
jgi:hypothetical protein